METKIRKSYLEALKAKDVVSKMTISLLINEIDKEKKTQKRELTDDEVLKLVTKEVKKRNQSIEAYESGGRTDLAEKEKQELGVLNFFLPVAMTYSELKELVKTIMVGNEGMHQGKIIGMVNKETKGLVSMEDIKKAIAEA